MVRCRSNALIREVKGEAPAYLSTRLFLRQDLIVVVSLAQMSPREYGRT